MTDTDQSIAFRVKELMKRRSREERLYMGFSMYDAAKTLVVSSISAKHPHLSPQRLRFEIFLRFYGKEVGREQLEKIEKYFG